MRKTNIEYKDISWIKNFIDDSRNINTPFKATTGGQKAERFSTAAEAWDFFNTCRTRCLLTFNTNDKQRILAYKF